MLKTSHWRHYRNYVFLLPLFVVALFYQATYSVVAARVVANSTSVPSRPFANDGRIVTGLDEQTRAAGLHPGDRILAINGRDFVGTRVLFEEIQKVKRGDRLSLTVTT